MRVFTLMLLFLGSVAWAAQPTKRPSDAQRGEELYNRHCFQCHGETNRGDGPATSALVATVPDLKGKTKTDEAAQRIVLRGRGPMPGFEASFDINDARRVLKHMQGLPKPKPEPADKDATDEQPEEADPQAEEEPEELEEAAQPPTEE
jgi:mono/diheme cytochrome c family protein